MSSFPVVQRKEKLEKVSEARVCSYHFPNRKWELYFLQSEPVGRWSQAKVEEGQILQVHTTLVLSMEGEARWAPVSSLWEKMRWGEGIGSRSYSPYNTGAKDISSKQAFNMVYANEVPSSLDFQSRNARTIQRCYFPFDFPFPRLSHSFACLNLHVVKVCSQVTWGQARKHKPTRGQRMWGYVLAQALTLFLPKREAWAKWLGS